MKKKTIKKDTGVAGNKFGFKSLDEVFNYSRKQNYAAKNKDEYQTEISRMNIADLQTHAISLGVKPSRNRAMLEKNLLAIYRRNGGNQFGVVDASVKTKNLKQVLDILSKGA